MNSQDDSILFENHWTPEPETLVSAFRAFLRQKAPKARFSWKKA